MAKTLSGEEHKALVTQTKSVNTAPSLPKPLLFGVATVLVVGIGFAAGMQYQKDHDKKSIAAIRTSQNSPTQLGSNAQNGLGGGRRRFGGQRPIVGTVTAIDASSITITDQNSTSSTYTVSDTTAVTDNGQTSSPSSIKVGESVAIIVSSTDTKQAARILRNPNFGNTPSVDSTNMTSPSTIN